jgi:pimeloyl-ACP methyl ester carboxylesterase
MLMPISMRRHGMAYDARSQSGMLPVFPIDRIQTPTMLVRAADDLYQTLRVARHAAQLIPNARLLAFESGGHLLLGHGDEMWPQVAEFMRSVAIHDRWDPARSGAPALLPLLWSQMAYRR